MRVMCLTLVQARSPLAEATIELTLGAGDSDRTVTHVTEEGAVHVETSAIIQAGLKERAGGVCDVAGGANGCRIGARRWVEGTQLGRGCILEKREESLENEPTDISLP